MAFTISASPESAQTSDLLKLPIEILNSVVSHLPNHGIKNLRLTCHRLHGLASLRLGRVFLSANPRNIQVFAAVAQHDEFRKQVTEIVWDDARLPHDHREYNNIDWEEAYEYDSDDDAENDDGADDPEECPRWVLRACQENEQQLKQRRGNDNTEGGRRPDHIARAALLEAQMPRGEAWAYYCELLQQQDVVIRTNHDVDAFTNALSHKRFPNLQRVTITPVAHGFLFSPRYETPMIRAFPPGFNYPIPRTWPGMLSEPPDAVPQPLEEEEKNKWRGFWAVTRAIAHLCEPPHEEPACIVPEIVVDVNGLHTGINVKVFEEPPCAEYTDLVKVLAQPSFRRIDLAVIVGNQWYENWAAFRSGLLHRAWAGAKDLEHVSLKANITESDPDATNATDDRHFIPLLTIMPVDKWLHLRHFGLARFLVRQNDLLGLLAALPSTIRTVELSLLCFLPEQGSYAGLLQDMRDTLGWSDRTTADRPRVTVGLDPVDLPALPGRAIWVDDEISAFLYENAGNPFGAQGWGVDQVPHGTGWIRDAFEPAYKRPWIDGISLIRQGYSEWNPWLMPSPYTYSGLLEYEQRKRQEVSGL